MFGINGLLYIPHYISQLEHDALLQNLDAQPWRGDLVRRTQHYGYAYDYRAKKIDLSAFLGELPPWLQRIADQLHSDGLIGQVPDQAIVNEYEPGQGIASHIDCVPCFGSTVISVSLGSSVVMDLKKHEQHVPLLLEPRSLFVLRGEARYSWTHGITKRRSDTYNSRTIQRARRISITFRNIVLAADS